MEFDPDSLSFGEDLGEDIKKDPSLDASQMQSSPTMKWKMHTGSMIPQPSSKNLKKLRFMSIFLVFQAGLPWQQPKEISCCWGLLNQQDYVCTPFTASRCESERTENQQDSRLLDEEGSGSGKHRSVCEICREAQSKKEKMRWCYCCCSWYLLVFEILF